MQFSSRQTKGFILVLLLSSPWLLCQAWIATSAPDEVWNTMPVCPESSGNCAHIGGDADYRMDGEYTLTLNQSAEEVWGALQQYIDDSGADVLFEEKQESGESYTHLVERTVFWRFPDDVAVHVTVIDENSCTVELHSQSRLGGGDLGVNPKRLEGLYEALTE
tara:strand:+ start:1366 stop:1854 length:489 start_codon:yes stop_codon:yes gene_type:complete